VNSLSQVCLNYIPIPELTITLLLVSQRGVVFFRAQDNLTADLQKELIQKIGILSGKPASSGLHIHPILNSDREGYRVTDPEISTIDSELNKKLYKGKEEGKSSFIPPKQRAGQWHSDIAFEPVPADYSSLRLEVLPKTGGDTLWASGYEIYDRISAPYQKFLEGLTTTFAQPGFIAAAERGGFQIYDKPRGSPENVGKELTAVHPVVRTNPVTGWKSIFPIGGHISHINDITELESQALLKWFGRLLVDNHDLQVRFKWRNKNDIAIWDNRSVFHTATFDIEGQGERYGVRTVSIGEKPYFDPESKSRRADLAAQAEVKA
jgi:alpha-ketoglutarate-dependent taurine dioxygenase